MSTAVVETPGKVIPATTPGTRRRKRKQALIGWSFALPFVLLFLVFMAGPILAAFITSFTDMRVTDIRNPFSVDFVGFENYADVLSDPKFRKAALNTAIYVIVAVPLTMALGLLIALGLNQAVVVGRNFFRVGYYLPQVTAVIAIAVVWKLMLGTENGLINGVLDSFGIEGPGWLTDTRYALGSIIAMTTWKGLGLQMIIFLAGLQAIPRMLYEAASVDGAGRWQQFRYVTIPALRPTLLFSSVIASIGLLQIFDEPYVMTQGGPLDATRTLAFHTYDQFSFGNYGYTAAAAYIMFLVIAGLAALQFRVFRPNT